MDVPIYYLSDRDTKEVVSFLRENGFRDYSFRELYMPVGGNWCLKSDFELGVKDEKAVLIWGNGFFHNISYFFSPKGPFFKSVDDAHNDLRVYGGNAESQTNSVINCANHNTALLKTNKDLEAISIFGPSGRPVLSLEDYNHYLTGKLLFEKKSDEYSQVRGKRIHKSIDLDVIEYYPCSEVWFEDGEHKLETLEKRFRYLMSNNDVVRFDIGGLDLSSLNSDFVNRDLAFHAYKSLIQIFIGHS